MRNVSFQEAFDRLVGLEDGYSNNPKDAGLETKWGISKRSYPNEDIKNMPRERAAFLYKRDFWDMLPTIRISVKYQLMDFAVNSGMQTAIKVLQKEVGVVPDGVWGPLSTAAEAKKEENDTLISLLAARLEFLVSLPKWTSFSKAWARRVATNLRYATQDN